MNWVRLRDEQLRDGSPVLRYRVGKDATITSSRLGVTVRGPFDAMRECDASDLARLLALAGLQQGRLERGESVLLPAEESAFCEQAATRKAS